MALASILWGILQRPSISDIMMELFVFTIPLWIAVFIGVLVGWAWKPKWANLAGDGLDSSSFSMGFVSLPNLNSLKLQFPGFISWIVDTNESSSSSSAPNSDDSSSSSSQVEGGGRKSCVVMEDDLRHLYQLVEEKDGGPDWIQMMDRSTARMSYQAWRRDPETGPPQYRSRTVYEDVSPEMVRDFFWDDDFRSKWDDMLLHSEILEEYPSNGAMVVQWIRKFPFFCSDREYIIGRRIWESEGTYYCITKGIPNSSVPRRDKPRRVDLYYSSWFIRAVESKKRGGDDRTACEVVLFHHEDMGIPWEIAKLGIRQGMWGAVKKIDPGLRAYLKERASSSDSPISSSVSLARVSTKVDSNYLGELQDSRMVGDGGSSEIETSGVDDSEKALGGNNIPRLLVVGGAIVLACSLDQGLLTKAVIFGVARRLARIGKRM
ncbi:uncharacterized protein LOC124919502 isoform X1 [Impatiens glandulifera]|uniref:uncharacterized protein LOC124919502 isoform X1 n=1 Tax=Impatiens glandulifera TaxID=253017 RepID=UPI001FB05A7F|nr:uncharacterized protein LOC124919502 isoform X1 [Impatiens glandulifera]